MTKVSLSQRGSRYGIECQGHATGSVQVCAAVSTLVTTLAGWLHNAQGVELITERLNTADAKLEYIGGADAETAFELVMVGFLQLAASYGEYISVEILQE
jgi:uncharacterized protein YsxB (DUF464 family)